MSTTITEQLPLSSTSKRRVRHPQQGTTITPAPAQTAEELLAIIFGTSNSGEDDLRGSEAIAKVAKVLHAMPGTAQLETIREVIGTWEQPLLHQLMEMVAPEFDPPSIMDVLEGAICEVPNEKRSQIAWSLLNDLPQEHQGKFVKDMIHKWYLDGRIVPLLKAFNELSEEVFPKGVPSPTIKGISDHLIDISEAFALDNLGEQIRTQTEQLLSLCDHSVLIIRLVAHYYARVNGYDVDNVLGGEHGNDKDDVEDICFKAISKAIKISPKALLSSGSDTENDTTWSRSGDSGNANRLSSVHSSPEDEPASSRQRSPSRLPNPTPEARLPSGPVGGSLGSDGTAGCQNNASQVAIAKAAVEMMSDFDSSQPQLVGSSSPRKRQPNHNLKPPNTPSRTPGKRITTKGAITKPGRSNVASTTRRSVPPKPEPKSPAKEVDRPISAPAATFASPSLSQSVAGGLAEPATRHRSIFKVTEKGQLDDQGRLPTRAQGGPFCDCPAPPGCQRRTLFIPEMLRTYDNLDMPAVLEYNGENPEIARNLSPVPGWCLLVEKKTQIDPNLVPAQDAPLLEMGLLNASSGHFVQEPEFNGMGSADDNIAFQQVGPSPAFHFGKFEETSGPTVDPEPFDMPAPPQITTYPNQIQSDPVDINFSLGFSPLEQVSAEAAWVQPSLCGMGSWTASAPVGFYPPGSMGGLLPGSGDNSATSSLDLPSLGQYDEVPEDLSNLLATLPDDISYALY